MRGLAIFLLGIISQDALANGWLVLPSAFYSRTSSQIDGAESSQSHFYVDGRAMYRWDSGFALGGLLSTTTGAGNNSYALTQTGLGVTVGYLRDGWVAAFGYMPVANRLEKLNSNTTSRSDGSGLQFEAGYLFPLTPSLLLGPTLNFRQVVFTQQKVNSRDTQGATFRIEEWRPAVSLLFLL